MKISVKVTVTYYRSLQMQDLNDKITGNDLSAAEWNEPASEIQNVIEGLGITLSGADLNQLGKGIAGYAANGDYYTDSGAADAYVLTQIGSKQAPSAYTEGFHTVFKAGNANTGASTINVSGLGVVAIKTPGGADLSADDIQANATIELRYDSANGWFEILSLLATAGRLVQVVNIQDGAVATGTALIPDDNAKPQNTEGDEYMVLAITPIDSSNILEITIYMHFESTASDVMVMALFQDSTADAIATSLVGKSSSQAGILSFKYRMVAGTISATTFKVRMGSNAVGTTTFNGRAGAPRHNGTIASSITVKEIQA